jgi:hypothetical protein
MGKRIAGTFNGTGADLYLGIGFIPDWIRLINLEDGDEVSVFWSKHLRSLEQIEGLQLHDSTTSPLTKGNGIIPYVGGDVFTSAQTAYIREEPDDRDMRDSSGGTGTITAWTLGSAANYTGSFDEGVDTSYVGEGSRVYIEESVGHEFKWATITALSNDGDAANEVTLSVPAKSGIVHFLSAMYDYTGVAAGERMPAGVKISNTTLNVSGNLCMFEAGTYDN